MQIQEEIMPQFDEQAMWFYFLVNFQAAHWIKDNMNKY